MSLLETLGTLHPSEFVINIQLQCLSKQIFPLVSLCGTLNHFLIHKSRVFVLFDSQNDSRVRSHLRILLVSVLLALVTAPYPVPLFVFQASLHREVHLLLYSCVYLSSLSSVLSSVSISLWHIRALFRSILISGHL